jgi:hypothetical protein
VTKLSSSTTFILTVTKSKRKKRQL